MNRFFRGAIFFLCNLILFASCLPSLARYYSGAFTVRRTQRRILRGILRKNRNAVWLNRRLASPLPLVQGFEALSPVDYDDIAPDIQRIASGENNVLTSERILLLQPTSGSASATKLIPYTQSLKRQFHAALGPWIASLYATWPTLFLGTQYWSISPATRVSFPESAIPVGFALDADYLNPVQARLAKFLSPLPPEISLVADAGSFEYLTCLFLLRDRNLSFISIWHPSFLTCILDVLEEKAAQICSDIENGAISVRVGIGAETLKNLQVKNRPDPRRAAELASYGLSHRENWRQIWPMLRIISCWTEKGASSAAALLEELFPSVSIQSKGLIATEGIVSFPLGRKRRVLAVRSHYLEFIDASDGCIRNAWELARGGRYGVLITTAGGLYRYRLHDIVEVSDFFKNIPCVSFEGRDNLVSDLAGEKLNISHIERALQSIDKVSGFFMLAPHYALGKPGYVLFLEADASLPYDDCRRRVEQGLFENYHYRHAINLKQLRPLTVFAVTGNAYRRYIDHLTSKGQKRGDIKVLALRPETDWVSIFDGSFVAEGNSLAPRFEEAAGVATQKKAS